MMAMRVLFRTAILMSIFSLLISGCEKSAPQNAKDGPNVYCAPFYKETGEVVEYNDDGTLKRTTQFLEFQTASGFKMRILRGSGGLGQPNRQCQMESGEFSFRWVSGKLLPAWDYKTGKANQEGSMVEYFVRFALPSENSVRKFDYPKWMFDGAFRIPGHEKILVLPFADFGDPKLIPTDRNNRALWRPRLFLEDVRDLVGNSLTFFCDSGLSYEEKGGALQVLVNHPRKNADHCMGGLAFASGAGGRLDIYDEDFLGQGTAITNAVIKELNSYIIKE